MQNIITKEMVKRAEHFIVNWRGTTNEKAEAQTFTNEFFEIFGLNRKSLASFEKPIKKKNENGIGFADLFWYGKLIIESKSAHLDSQKHWDKTLQQAKEYIDDLPIQQKPKYILLMNFKRIQKHQVQVTESKTKIVFVCEVPLEDLAEKLNEFEFFLDFANRLESDEEKANQLAADKIANLYNAIERKGYNSTDIALLLARIMFCLFAEDTNIFEKKKFENYIKDKTNGDNLGKKLLELFDTLNTPQNKRKNKSSDTYTFPYVNGDLFNISLSKIPKTNDAMHLALIDCCKYDWSVISPVIFGSLFQAVLEDDERRKSGSHYTSEKNIIKALQPLFLRDLNNEFESIKNSKKGLENFRKKINGLCFLDPACGCGNFLVVTYREIRLLDIEIIKIQYKGKFVTDASLLSNISLKNFYGYEIDPTSAMIAEVAMWLTEHQMNMRLEAEFGVAVPTIPLHEAANITNQNALQIDWLKTNLGKSFNYIVGNPPFIGKQNQTTEQKNDLKNVLYGIDGAGVLDFVTCWYIKAAQYIDKNPKTKCALVSTNSISQGEQTGILWNELFNTYKLKIHFAHQTFKWHNEAKGVAAVHCVIIGFGRENVKDKYIYEYDDIKGEPTEIKVKNINPYLLKGNDTVVLKRRKPICNVSEISFGSMPNDGGHLLLDDEVKNEIVKQYPIIKKWIKPLVSAHEFLNGKKRWCLWLADTDPKERKECSEVFKRIQAVKKHRESSSRAATNKLASQSWLFGEIRQPKKSYILIPRHSSENRKYIPFAFLSNKNIVSDSCLAIDNASLYHFGILTSAMHNVWVKYVCGRIKSDFRYSNEIVYNNFPFPNSVSEKNKKAVEKAVEAMFLIRDKYIAKGSTLADIYEASNMPIDLSKAHQLIDKEVDNCYGNKILKTDIQRMEFLFELYDTYTMGLFA